MSIENFAIKLLNIALSYVSSVAGLCSCLVTRSRRSTFGTRVHKINICARKSLFFIDSTGITMFDPLSALSCIGFVVGVIGAVATTLSKIDERVDDVRECKDRLQHFTWQLEDSHLQLKAWRSTWISELDQEDGSYIYFWGKEGFDQVQARMGSLLKLSTRIKTLLRQPSHIDDDQPISSSERLEWQRSIDWESSETITLSGFGNFGERKLSLLRRIGFSLFRNAALQEKMGRFKTQIQGLDDFPTELSD